MTSARHNNDGNSREVDRVSCEKLRVQEGCRSDKILKLVRRLDQPAAWRGEEQGKRNLPLSLSQSCESTLTPSGSNPSMNWRRTASSSQKVGIYFIPLPNLAIMVMPTLVWVGTSFLVKL